MVTTEALYSIGRSFYEVREKIEDNIRTEKIVDLYAESGETSSLPNQGQSNPKRPTTVMWP